MKKYEGSVVEICENGDAIIQFPDDMMEELGWKAGDTVNISEKNGAIIIKKVNHEDKNISS